MAKPYLAVLNAYWSSWTMRIVSALLVVFLALSQIGRDPGRLGAWPLIPVLLVSCLFALSFTGLTKEQFATPRARVVPEFNKHHLLVAGAMGAVFWLLTTGVLADATASTFLGAASVLAALYAFIAWGTCVHPVVLLVLVGLMYEFCCTGRGLAQITRIVCGDMLLVNLALLGGGLSCLALLGWKLSRLTEEHREYELRFKGPSSPGALTTSQRRAISRSWFVRLQGWRLEDLLARPITGTWQGVRRLRAASGFPSTALIAAAVLISAWTVMALLEPQGTPSPQLAFVGLLGVLMNWRISARRLNQELVRPVDRGELMRQFGLMLIVDVFVFWFTVAALTAVTWAALSPGLLVDFRMWHGVGIAFCGMPLFVGVSGFALRVRSDLGFWTASMLIYMASLMTIVVTISGRPSLSVTPWLGAGLLVAGGCACYGAYRVWLAGDID